MDGPHHFVPHSPGFLAEDIYNNCIITRIVVLISTHTPYNARGANVYFNWLVVMENLLRLT
jgi:hypothetical protein